MSCSCKNKRFSQEAERMRRLAKALAVMEQETVALYKNADGTYGFSRISDELDKSIVEYITPY